MNIVYVAELSADIDDLIAAEYLHLKKVLTQIVLDPYPKDKEGLERIKDLQNMGITILEEIPTNTDIIICGGAFTKIAKYVKTNKLKTLIANGGFVGNNIVKEPLEKFKNKKEIRTFNFNIDANSTDKVLKSKNIDKIILIGKNVCHDIKNTQPHIWKNEEFLNKYNLKETKRLHDLLAAKEGLILEGILKEESILNFKEVYPYNLELNGAYTLWGSSLKETNYRKVIAAINFK